MARTATPLPPAQLHLTLAPLRQDDTARALVLFGDRIAPGALSSPLESRALLEEAAYDKVLTLADRLGVNLVP